MKSQLLVKVWDLPIRIFHWLLVACFFVAYVTEDELLTLHVWAGYLILGLLAFRLIWGFIGNQYARFSNFLCSPTQSIRYTQDLIRLKANRYIGHNPAGAAMIVLLLIGLLITTLTGLAAYGADQGAGPLANIGSNYEKIWEELHEFSANLTLVMVAIHVLGVGVESYIHKENLVKSMINGFKKSADN